VTDEELVLLARQGDTSAFDQLVVRYRDEGADSSRLSSPLPASQTQMRKAVKARRHSHHHRRPRLQPEANSPHRPHRQPPSMCELTSR
jgi:hypothetical protein